MIVISNYYLKFNSNTAFGDFISSNQKKCETVKQVSRNINRM